MTERIPLKAFSRARTFNEASSSPRLPERKFFLRSEEARYALSLVADPLWKRVCGEILSLMGPYGGAILPSPTWGSPG